MTSTGKIPYICRLKKTIQYLFLPLLMMTAFACSKYQRVLKSSDVELKYEYATKYYNEGDYAKAFPLYEEIGPLFRGSERSEEINYNYAYCNYHLKDFILAGYHFQRFYTVFPLSDKSEDAMFMSAYCFYLNSPVYSLDQSNTKEALGEFKKFNNTYPTSSLRDSSLVLMKEMNAKLERKAFENAELQFTLENYKSAVVAFNNFLKDFPESSTYKEKTSFLILKSSFLLAINSVQKKKEERINDTIDAYYNFVDNFANEKLIKESEEMYDQILKERDNLITEK
ncbi:MAG TPA: outer membrane protein assembly factor BamD [Flavobacteriales bacterium]|nr:outer membrane protein assembly factor BamD [Flavobacteriales bacterium]